MRARRLCWPLALAALCQPVLAPTPAAAAFTPDPAFAAAVAKGRKLTDDAAKKLEAAVAQHPDDAAARGQLLGYFLDRSAAYPQRRLPHLLWAIGHRPADPLTPTVTAVNPLSEPDGYAKASAAWDAQVSARPTDTAVLADAAAFYDNGTDTPKAQDLLRRAMTAEPKSGQWPARLAASLEREADRDPARAVDLCTQALAQRQEAYTLSESRVDRFHVLLGQPNDAYRTGDMIVTKRLAKQLLDTADDFPADPARGEAMHRAHVVLGLVDLHNGNADRAAEHLAAAAKVPPSPVITANGPDWSLARAMLAHGDRSPVRAYLVDCQTLWPGGRERLKSWVTQLDAGGTPEMR